MYLFPFSMSSISWSIAVLNQFFARLKHLVFFDSLVCETAQRFLGLPPLTYEISLRPK